MSKRKVKKAASNIKKKQPKKETQKNSYELSADNLRAAIEEFMRSRSLLRPDEVIVTWFPAIKLDIEKEVIIK